MSSIVTALLWITIGAVVASAHFIILRTAVQRARNLESTDAQRRISNGLPLRLLLWFPALLLAAHSGFIPCVALIVGLLLARWSLYLWTIRHGQFIPVLDQQGESRGH